MSSLMLRCLGAFEVTLNGVTVPGFPTDKIRALLAYLALEQAHPHRRDALNVLFWPEILPSAAQNNLRVTLHRLRETLHKVQPGSVEALLNTTRQTVQLDPALITVDALTFQRLLATCAAHSHPALASCDECLPRLAEAADLYRGELLAGLGLADAPAFEEWLLLRRETLHQQALATLHTLVQAYEQRDNALEAHRYASRQLALDPYQEEAHRQLMRILVRRGLRTEALAQYETCRRLLREQLDVAPDLETSTLYEQIRAGKLDQETSDNRAYGLKAQGTEGPTQPGTLSPARPGPLPQVQDWSEAPEVSKLYGRQTELTELTRWLVHTPGAPRAQLVALLGIGGVGKTTLAAATVKAVTPHFAYVIWRSLLNAPPPEELLRDLLHRLAEEQLTDLPNGLDAQLALLLDYLRQRRCLLVLDNLESILHPDQPGQMRPGYTQLLQTVATYHHQSCLLFTSRERPQGMEQWEEDSPLVRILPLDGLDALAGQAMLHARGLTGPTIDAASLVTRYSGNPLALKLIAQTVQELFSGDIAAFLAVETPIFDDIRLVLDQQFERLSPLEQEILLWLAIEREPVTIQILRDNLVQPGAPRVLIEALRALQRRSLVGQSPQGFLLQNVIIEYLTDVLVEQVCQEILAYAPSTSTVSSQQLKSKLLNRHALLKATAKEYVRASQSRLILHPIGERLLANLGKSGLVGRLQQLLAALRTEDATPGYTAGNLLNLLLHLQVDVGGYDFTGLNVWQANLQGAALPAVNFTGANLMHTRFSHSFGQILAIQWAENGQLLIASLVQGRLCLWRVQGAPAAGQLLHEAQSFEVSAAVAKFSPDGRWLVSDHMDYQVRLWDVATGQLLHTLTGSTEYPWTFAFSADGQWLACCGGDELVYLWKLTTGAFWQSLRAPGGVVAALAFAPTHEQGQLLAAGDIDGTIYVWRLGDVTPLHILRGHQEEVHALGFAANGALLASGSHDRTIQVWETQSGALRYTLRTHSHPIRSLAVSADGYTLASGGDDTFVALWDLHTGELRQLLLGLTNRINYLAFNSAANRLPATLATVSTDQSIGLWDAEAGRRVQALHAYSNHIYTLDVSADGRFLAVGGTDKLVQLWDIAPARTPNGAAQPAQEDKPVALVRTFLGHTQWIAAVAFAPANPALGTTGYPLASADRSGVIQLWDTADGRHLRTLHGHQDDVEALAFSPDGQQLVSLGRDATIQVWDLQRGAILTTLHGHTDRLRTCAFSPDGRTLATGGHDRTVRLWAMTEDAPGRRLHTLAGHTNGVRCVCFSPDGRLLASSSYDHQVMLWEVASGQIFATLPLQEVTVLALAFHPQGRWLAMGMNADTIRIWDLAQQCVYAVLHGHTNSVETLRFSPDGQWLVSGSWDETVRLWDVTTGVCRQILRAPGPYAGMNITNVTGISAAQKAALRALGAVEG